MWVFRLAIGAAIFMAAAVAVTERGVEAESTPTPTPKPSAPAADASEPDNTTASYGDWALHCVRSENSGRVCELQQTLEVKGQGTVAQIAVGRTTPKGPWTATVLLPVNVSFPSSVQMAVDDKDDSAAELAWKQCVPGGCLAQAELRDEIIKHWRALTGRGQIRFITASKQPLNFAFSFRGFASALENLGKASPPQ